MDSTPVWALVVGLIVIILIGLVILGIVKRALRCVSGIVLLLVLAGIGLVIYLVVFSGGT
jgi:hypothetical protein